MAVTTQPFTVNIGPQHPSTHGVFRVQVSVDGEIIVDLKPVMGYLHRGTEKLAEEKTYTQCIPYTDRMDYIAAMSNELGYVMAVEKLAGIVTPPRAVWIRMIMAELQRISSHLFAAATFFQDIGGWGTAIMYMLGRDREEILDIFEMTCGQRLTTNYMRIGGVAQDLPDGFGERVRAFLAVMPGRIDEYYDLLANSELLITRTKGVGILPRELAISSACAGPMLRGSGVAWDLRKSDPYLYYDQVDFDVIVGQNGDSYDRFMVRFWEIGQSLRIIEQCLDKLPDGDVRHPFSPDFVSGTFRPPKGEAYAAIEGPKGELGYYLVSDGTTAPYRWHVRAPSLINLTPFREMCIGWKVADMIVILGSVDIVVGEVDR
ncbi:MAG: NADH-quinone oxidoreductase subunit D [Dehalococcoidia bacterium]